MSKLDSPVKRWPGSVTLPDYLTWPQVQIWREAANEANKATDPYSKNIAWVRGICKIATEFDLLGLPKQMTVETFPATPPKSSVALADWLISEIGALLDEADEAPNG